MSLKLVALANADALADDFFMYVARQKVFFGESCRKKSANACFLSRASSNDEQTLLTKVLGFQKRLIFLLKKVCGFLKKNKIPFRGSRQFN
ncbi:hypothetical protein ACO0LM_24005 [Undibacterium sp. Di26W]|uniref:hypothetical protein n=1 Tax=Undibacterium sp. Di26W TaxID=3413035 RepID=UPI003BF4413A